MSPQYPSDLTQPGAIDALLAFHRATFGDARMEEGAGGQQGADGAGQGGDGTDAAGAGGQQQDPGGAGGQQAPQGGDEKKFSQAELDRIIGERIQAEKARHEKALKDAQELAGKTEAEKLALERDQAKAETTATKKAAGQKIAAADAKLAALTLGAKADRVAAIVKNADLSDAIDEHGDVDEAKVKAAVEAVLADYPEWKAEAGTSTATPPPASGGDAPAGGGGKPTYTRAQIAAMSQQERVEKLDELKAAAAEGRIKG